MSYLDIEVNGPFSQPAWEPIRMVDLDLWAANEYVDSHSFRNKHTKEVVSREEFNRLVDAMILTQH